MIKKLLFAFLATCSVNAFAQDTYTQIYSILQTKCVGCHGAVSPSGLLNLTGSNPTNVYNSLVDANPTNPVALAKGNKRVVPGDPFRSFLYRKLLQHAAVDQFTHLETDGSEGGNMPEYPNAPLSNYEVELVRQWILYGAPMTGNVVDTAVINTFYTVGGINMNPVIPAAPDSGEGMQFHVGRIFLPPGGDREIFFKINPMIGQDVEVTRIFLVSPLENHHFVIYKFFNGMDANFPAGIRNNTEGSHGSTEAVSGFKNLDNDLIFPTGTALLVPGNSIYDYNFHIVNTSADSVLAGDIYFNYYTQPVGTADKYIYTLAYPNFNIAIPWDNQEHTFTAVANDTNNIETNYWMVWHLYTHTHRYGTDYDIYLRNGDGSQGEQVYEGFYNQDYTFNQGYYAWSIEGVPQRFFDEPFLKVDPRTGFIHTTKFNNTSGPDTVFFGSTAMDEMMVMGFQYFYGDPLPLSIDEKESNPFKIYPNPGKGDFVVSFDENFASGQTIVQVNNAVGQMVKEIVLTNVQSSNYTLNLNELSCGLYNVKIISENKFYTQKLVKE